MNPIFLHFPNDLELRLPEDKTCYFFTGNPHYRIVDSYVQNGRRSTLIVIGAMDTDFGIYTCRVANPLGEAELYIELEQESMFF